ncbi:hypothetical protein JHK84_026837 [Glycine max]|nr:hypothetical protein JHK86_026726 [Glycine max]KAG5150365.1 hypothetical protein JHK84_026837 [Glycine max]
MELLGGINTFPTSSEKNQKQQYDFNFDPLMLEEFNFVLVHQPKQSLQEIKEPKKNEQVLPSSIASLELLSNYGSRFKRLGKQNIIDSNVQTCVSTPQKLSTEEIIRLAVARTQFLLAAAERVGCQQFERSSMLLSYFQFQVMVPFRELFFISLKHYKKESEEKL